MSWSGNNRVQISIQWRIWGGCPDKRIVEQPHSRCIYYILGWMQWINAESGFQILYFLLDNTIDGVFQFGIRQAFSLVSRFPFLVLPHFVSQTIKHPAKCSRRWADNLCFVLFHFFSLNPCGLEGCCTRRYRWTDKDLHPLQLCCMSATVTLRWRELNNCQIPACTRCPLVLYMALT